MIAALLSLIARSDAKRLMQMHPGHILPLAHRRHPCHLDPSIGPSSMKFRIMLEAQASLFSEKTILHTNTVQKFSNK
eukprot:5324544-Amphidinium_carterae.1